MTREIGPMKQVILFAAFLLIVPGVPNATAREHANTPSIHLMVSMFNDAGVAPSVWSEARARATGIMEASGVSLDWLDCGSPNAGPEPSLGCAAISFPSHLSVRVVPMASPVGNHIFGQSFQDAAGEGNYAVVYFSGIEAFRPSPAVSTGSLLGTVIAHEVGHLLLGGNSHSTAGLMSAVWQFPELQAIKRGTLLFSAAEEKRIHLRFLAAVARRRTGASVYIASGK
jgi:hypothetical protein